METVILFGVQYFEQLYIEQCSFVMLNGNLAQSLREVWSQSVVPAIVQVTRPVTRPHVLILAHLLPPPSLALYSTLAPLTALTALITLSRGHKG